MKLGFVSAVFADLPLEDVVAFAGEAGFACVELMCWPRGRAERRYAGVTHIDAAALDANEIRRVREVVGAAGVEISALGYYPNPLSADRAESERAIDHLRKVIRGAADLEVGLVTTFIGRDPESSIDASWTRFLELWPPIVDHAEKLGIRVAIENCPMLYTTDEWPGGKNLAVSPAIWRRMFEAIPSGSFGLNYDPSHLVWQQIDPIAPIREFRGRIFHAHAKDVRLDRERLDDVGILATPLEYHTPKLPGLGEVEWGRFFSVLGDAGYRGPLCIEVEDRAYEGSLESRKAALRQSARFLRGFME